MPFHGSFLMRYWQSLFVISKPIGMSVVQPMLKICPDYDDSLHCGTGRFLYILCRLASVREDRRENPMFCRQIAKLLSCLPLFPLSFCNYGQQMIIFLPRSCPWPSSSSSSSSFQFLKSKTQPKCLPTFQLSILEWSRFIDSPSKKGVETHTDYLL